MRVNREDAYLDIIPDLRAGTGVGFEFKSGSKLSCEIENVYVFTGSAEPDNMYNLGYVILRPGDVPEFVNNDLKSITIGDFTFKMEDPELLKRHVLALNDGLLYFER